MGYEFYPQALENVIRKVASAFKNDIYVTENGLSSDDDSKRIKFIEAAIDGVHNCIADGIKVKGYFYWTFMDNFEWQKGYAPKFGLVAVDRQTKERTVKPSLFYLASAINKGDK